jgi:hypothetical protein
VTVVASPRSTKRGQVATAFLTLVGLHLAAAGAVIGSSYFAGAHEHRPPSCVDSCIGSGIVQLLLVGVALITLAVGLIVAPIVLALRIRRLRGRGEPLPPGWRLGIRYCAAVVPALLAVALLLIMGLSGASSG